MYRLQFLFIKHQVIGIPRILKSQTTSFPNVGWGIPTIKTINAMPVNLSHTDPATVWG